ncbi:hypothetical protein [uncultured Aquimarina sp.]|uniref:hypothetical protein n=1 Tax=uncultured Aquimarina sp. TaxID=575652 RepID=UPI00262EB004|nr:hypothetical protein [uncultured Aquimarina sp.]
MKKSILNLEGVSIINKREQQEINGGFSPICPIFQECFSDNDCPCGPCGVVINGFVIDDLCAF